MSSGRRLQQGLHLDVSALAASQLQACRFGEVLTDVATPGRSAPRSERRTGRVFGTGCAAGRAGRGRATAGHAQDPPNACSLEQRPADRGRSEHYSVFRAGSVVRVENRSFILRKGCSSQTWEPTATGNARPSAASARPCRQRPELRPGAVALFPLRRLAAPFESSPPGKPHQEAYGHRRQQDEIGVEAAPDDVWPG